MHLILDAQATRGLNDRERVRSWIREAIGLAGMTEIGEVSAILRTEDDSGPGISVLALIAESHVSVHTWPEHGRVSMDFYSCKHFDKDPVIESFHAHFGVTEVLGYHVIDRVDMSVEAPCT